VTPAAHMIDAPILAIRRPRIASAPGSEKKAPSESGRRLDLVAAASLGTA
jgi:hypothetical protein